MNSQTANSQTTRHGIVRLPADFARHFDSTIPAQTPTNHNLTPRAKAAADMLPSSMVAVIRELAAKGYYVETIQNEISEQFKLSARYDTTTLNRIATVAASLRGN